MSNGAVALTRGSPVYKADNILKVSKNKRKDCCQLYIFFTCAEHMFMVSYNYIIEDHFAMKVVGRSWLSYFEERT